MPVEPKPRYADPYGIDDVVEALLIEDGEDVLIAHDRAPSRPDRIVYFVDGVRRTDSLDVLESGPVTRDRDNRTYVRSAVH